MFGDKIQIRKWKKGYDMIHSGGKGVHLSHNPTSYIIIT